MHHFNSSNFHFYIYIIIKCICPTCFAVMVISFMCFVFKLAHSPYGLRFYTISWQVMFAFLDSTTMNIFFYTRYYHRKKQSKRVASVQLPNGAVYLSGCPTKFAPMGRTLKSKKYGWVFRFLIKFLVRDVIRSG